MQSSLRWELWIVCTYGNPVKMETLVSHYRTDIIIYLLFSHFFPILPHLGLWILSHCSSVAQAYSCLPGGWRTSGYFRLWKMVVTNWLDIWWNICNVCFSPGCCRPYHLFRRAGIIALYFYLCTVWLFLIWELCLWQHCLCSSANLTFPGNMNNYWTVWSYAMRKVFVY